MTIYSTFAALANTLLASDKGETGAIRRTVISGGGPADPTGGTTITTDYPCRLVTFPVAQRDVDGTTIKMGDFTVYVATGIDDPAGAAAAWDAAPETGVYAVSADGLTIKPTTTDRVICSYGILTILDAGLFAPTGTVTHYKMRARK